MTWRSTTVRFALLVFAMQLAAGVAMMAIVYAVVRSEMRAAASLRADTVRDDLLLTYMQGGPPAVAEAVAMRVRNAITPGTVVLLTEANGRPVAGNLSDWPPSVLAEAEPREVRLYRTDRLVAEAMWVRATRLPDGRRLLTGSVVEGETRLLRLLEGAGVLGLSLAAIFAVLAAWLAARMIVRRTERTVAVLEGARNGDLAQRVEVDRSGDAFAALSRSVNATLERLDALVGELKIATDGLAHDLKSPLTRLRSTLERGAVELDDPAALAVIDRALVEGDRVLSIVETAMRISRAEAGVERESFVDTDLSAELADLAEIYGPAAEDDGRAVEISAKVSVSIPVQRELLSQALGNLIDNSLKYGAGIITLGLESAADGLVVSVSDQGPGIPADQHEQALARFGRLDKARTHSGAGLGLALVGAVARLHGGSIELEDAGPGLRVLMRLPLPRAAEDCRDLPLVASTGERTARSPRPDRPVRTVGSDTV